MRTIVLSLLTPSFLFFFSFFFFFYSVHRIHFCVSSTLWKQNTFQHICKKCVKCEIAMREWVSARYNNFSFLLNDRSHTVDDQEEKKRQQKIVSLYLYAFSFLLFWFLASIFFFSLSSPSSIAWVNSLLISPVQFDFHFFRFFPLVFVCAQYS